MICRLARCKRHAGPNGICKTHDTQRRDREFSLMIRDRDGGCMRCGSAEFGQCAHVLSRSYRLTRWDPENAVRLCRDCHAWQTHHPLEGDEFFESIGIDLHALRMRALGKSA